MVPHEPPPSTHTRIAVCIPTIAATLGASGRPARTRKLAKMSITPAQHPGVVLIPVKAFGNAKGRLSEALDVDARADLAKEMATHVVSVQRNVAVAICCDDEGVAEWAESVDASVVWCPGTDLNGAVAAGLVAAREAGYESAAIAHSDLPMAVSLDGLLGWPGVTVVPDRHRTGTNVMTLPTAIDFQFSYGENSLQRHVIEAIRHGHGLRIVHHEALGWDVDHPADLELPHHTS